MNTSFPFFALNRCLLTLAGFSLVSVSGVAAANLEATHLRCEYLINPTAIDQTQPRLSWVVEVGKNRGVRQGAYQILVASDPQLLAKERADLWDSGKINSDQSIQVIYGGN